MNVAIIWLSIFITFCILMFLAWFFAHRAKHKERLAMIERGMHPDEKNANDKDKLSASQKLAVVVLGLSAGLVVIAVLANFGALGRSDAIPAAILGAFGAGALLVAHSFSNKK